MRIFSDPSKRATRGQARKEKMFPYEDIVNLEHYEDLSRKRMSRVSRAAQFMPFKSLSEYEDYVAEETESVNTAEDANYTILYE